MMGNILHNERFWKRVAIAAGVFSFVVCLLLIANYVQLKKANPINMTVINSLVERLSQNPNDNALRDQIRTLDLLSRKAYFTNLWQIRTGGYLVLAGILIMVIAFQIISLGRKKDPLISKENIENSALEQQIARKWIMISGGLIVVVALIIATLTHNELGNKFKEAAYTDKTQTEKADSTDLLSENTPPSAEAVTDSVANKPDSTKETKTIDSNDNYPNFRGVGGYGIAKQSGIPVTWDVKTGKNIKWKVEIPLPGYSSPIIWGNKIFLTGANTSKRAVFCFEKSSGKILWISYVEKIPGEPGQSPKVNDETGYSAPTAATDGKNVFAIFANGDIVAIDMEGKQIWAQNLGDPQNHYGHSSSLMIYKDLVIVQYDQKKSPKLVALSEQTGKTVWSTIRPVKISWSSPIIIKAGNRDEVIVCAEPYVMAYNPVNGEEIWKVSCIEGEVGPSPAYADGIVFSINDYSKLAAIKLGDQPEVIWENNDVLSDVPSPVATDNYLFVVSSGGTVVCYDTKTGTKYWEQEMNNAVYSSPIIAEGKVYLVDKTGIMHIFKADKEFKSLGTPALEEGTSCTPAFSKGEIILRGNKNLFCIGKD
jgi:outer membrane protein assembly factor BamB